MNIPIIELSYSGESANWVATTFKELKKSESEFENMLANENNLACFGIPELVDKRYKYKIFQQCILPRQNASNIRPDIIILREDGEVFIIEVKLGSNRELFDRRAIGQIIEYASAISELTDNDLAKMFGKNTSKSLGELFDEWFQESSYSVQNRMNLVENISTGKINLVIVSDFVPSGSYDWIDEWSTKSHLPFNFSAIQITPYQKIGESGLLLIPQEKIKTAIISRTVVEVREKSDVSVPEISISSAEEINQNTNSTKSTSEMIYGSLLTEVVNRVEGNWKINQRGPIWTKTCLRKTFKC